MKCPHNRIPDAAWRICATAVLCAAVSVSAQTVYKQTDGDGHITFTDQLEATPLPQTRGAADSEVVSALASGSPMTSKAAAAIDLNEAKRRLLRAQQSRRNTLPSSSGVTLDAVDVTLMNERYLRNQNSLDGEVVAAQRRSNELSSIRNVLPGKDDRTGSLKLAQP